MAAGTELTILSWNVSGHNTSKLSTLSLSEKHMLLAEEVLQHAPDAIALQEVPLDLLYGRPVPKEVQLLEVQLASAGYRREAWAESHCDYSCLYLHDRLRKHAGSTFGMEAAAVVELHVPLPGAASGGGGAEPWHQQQWRREQRELEAEEQRARECTERTKGVQPTQLHFDGCCSDPGESLGQAAPALEQQQQEELRQELWQQGQSTEEPPDYEPAKAPAGAEQLAGPAGPAPSGSQQPQQLARLCLAGVHLLPFPGGASARKAQLRELLSAAGERQATHLIVVGDFNMEEDGQETQAVLDLGLQDAHLVTRSQPCNAHTWDTTRNKYFGEETVEYTARYDRLCCSSNVEVRELRLVGNEPALDGSFLSDHFGILCKLVLRA